MSEKEEKRIERELLIEEYKTANEWGQHWDSLRWNVSKFFLSIETAFAIAALKGLFELIETNTSSNEALTFKLHLMYGLVGLTIINMFLCYIWWRRNTAIHMWHCAGLERQKLIEKDPLLKGKIIFFSSIIKILGGHEGFLIKIHGTGKLECYGPPLAFSLLWLGIVVLALYCCC